MDENFKLNVLIDLIGSGHCLMESDKGVPIVVLQVINAAVTNTCSTTSLNEAPEHVLSWLPVHLSQK